MPDVVVCATSGIRVLTKAAPQADQRHEPALSLRVCSRQQDRPICAADLLTHAAPQAITPAHVASGNCRARIPISLNARIGIKERDSLTYYRVAIRLDAWQNR